MAQSVCSSPAAAPAFVRGEGAAEQVGDLTFSCTGASGSATVRVFLSPVLPVTSAVLSTGTTAYTEALALSSSGAVQSAVQGVIDPAGTSLTFTGVSVPGTIRITNIRVNVSSVATAAALPPPIGETVFVSGVGISPALLPATTVAYVARGLASPSLTDVSTLASPFGVPGTGQPGNLTGCTTLTPALPAFFVKFGESLNSAFRQRGSAASNGTPGAWVGLNSETGYVPAAWPNTPGAGNLANSATRVKIVLTNVPQNVLVYVPAAPSTDVPGAGTLALTGSETGAFGAFGAIAPDSTNGLPSGAGAPGLSLVSTSGGTVTAVYEVTLQSGAIESYTIPVYLAWTAGTVTGTDTPIGVSVSFAPTGSPSNIPNFAVPAGASPLVGPTIASCYTSLLFPFVSNQSGFDTAIAISNSSSDPFGKNGALAQSGTCSLNLYGTGAPTPSGNILAPNGLGPGGSYVSGQSSVFLLSDIAAGFQGYLIAVCNFQYAHGFASLTSSFGQPNGTTMGYLALILSSRGRGTIVDSTGF